MRSILRAPDSCATSVGAFPAIGGVTDTLIAMTKRTSSSVTCAGTERFIAAAQGA